jgi:hypothetical protein
MVSHLVVSQAWSCSRSGNWLEWADLPIDCRRRHVWTVVEAALVLVDHASLLQWILSQAGLPMAYLPLWFGWRPGKLQGHVACGDGVPTEPCTSVPCLEG